MKRTVVFLGAGFSVAAGLPTTNALLTSFVDFDFDPESVNLQLFVSQQLQRYWKLVFGWNSKKRKPPTFEDHFTSLDLASNTGHQIGAYYTPRRLRAIRRLSLHRVFEVLDRRFQRSAAISRLLRELARGSENSIVSTNWDIVVEKHFQRLGVPFAYGIPVETLGGAPESFVSGIRLLKLHGSANWCYCDTCRRVFAFSKEAGKGAHRMGVFLETRDFEALDVDPKGLVRIQEELDRRPDINCSHCHVRLSARVATFSFQKALGFNQFEGVWQHALEVLRDAERWIFIGYSLPEADFELRHLLKTAQLAGSAERRLAIDVVLYRDREAMLRYRRFFGSRLGSTWNDGFESWVGSI